MSDLLNEGVAPNEDPPKESSERPTWLPEEYWDGGVAKVKELVTRLTDTQTALRNHKDQIRQEIEAELKSSRPETPLGYIVDRENLSIEGEPVNLPDDDPALVRVRQWAHEANLSQEHFNGLIKTYVQAIAEQVPNVDAEIAKLGENARERIGNVAAEARKILGEDKMPILTSMVRNSEQVKVLEELFAKRPSPASFNPSTPSSTDLELEISRILDSDAWYKRDPATLRRYQELNDALNNQRRRV